MFLCLNERLSDRNKKYHKIDIKKKKKKRREFIDYILISGKVLLQSGKNSNKGVESGETNKDKVYLSCM